MQIIGDSFTSFNPFTNSFILVIPLKDRFKAFSSRYVMADFRDCGLQDGNSTNNEIKDGDGGCKGRNCAASQGCGVGGFPSDSESDSDSDSDSGIDSFLH